MKKVVFLVMLLSCLVLSSCGASSSAKKQENYSEDYDKTLESIEELCTNANTVMTINAAVWNEAGPDHISECIEGMLTATEDEDYIRGGTYIYHAVTGKMISSLISESTMHSTCWPVIEQYQKAYSDLTEQIESVKEDVKSIKDNYGKDHSEAAEALQAYYTKAAAYADAAMNPSGNLLNYSKSLTEFENEIKELKTSAEFEK